MREVDIDGLLLGCSQTHEATCSQEALRKMW